MLDAILLALVVGFATGGLTVHASHLRRTSERHRRPPSSDDIGELLMAVKAAIQAQIDRLTPVPGEIDAKVSAAVAAAVAADAVDETDSNNALSAAVDAVVNKVAPAA